MSTTIIDVGDEVLAAVLRPYKPHCRYVKRARVELPDDGGEDHLVLCRGEFEIPESCYIDDTGHFNAVEFNISYNQLIYTLMAQCVISDIIPAFAKMSLDEYLARQLPDVLIHDFRSKFRKPMKAARFDGAVSIMDAVEKSRFLMLKTHVQFRDPKGGNSDGDVSLAIVDRSTGQRTGSAATSN
ncbi:MAG: hypothetical protein DHS20C15_31320 [Planctomycetota bacterium]|nr:MAG: hypothetical protein DHS20C15_31320 [Planctomycetota bacterium]